MLKASLYNGDCRIAMRSMADNSVDAIVTDPPYELGFMSKGWDKSGIAYNQEVWKQALRVLKPGGHLLAFGAPRTYHRLACAIEDAGFQTRDCITWMFGQGMPKSMWLNKSKGIGTNLKPAAELIVMARKDPGKSIASSFFQYGTGGININACKIGNEPVTINRWNDGAKPFGGGAGHDFTGHTSEGRWPANLVLSHAENCKQMGGGNQEGKITEVWECADDCPIKMLDEQTDGASRFFYCSKANRKERDIGCDDLPDNSASDMTGGRKPGSAGINNPRAGAGRTSGGKNIHPTVKPLALMRWLVRLVTPRGGTVLDPFMGSGTTGMACVIEGLHFIGIELSSEYLAIARARIAGSENGQPVIIRTPRLINRSPRPRGATNGVDTG